MTDLLTEDFYNCHKAGGSEGQGRAGSRKGMATKGGGAAAKGRKGSTMAAAAAPIGVRKGAPMARRGVKGRRQPNGRSLRGRQQAGGISGRLTGKALRDKLFNAIKIKEAKKNPRRIQSARTITYGPNGSVKIEKHY